MGKTFIGNPYSTEYEDEDLLTFVEEEEGPIEFESSVDSIDIMNMINDDSDGEDDFIFGSSNEWMDDDAYVTETEDEDDDLDEVIGIEEVPFPEVSEETISNTKPSNESEDSNTDINSPVQDSPAE